MKIFNIDVTIYSDDVIIWNSYKLKYKDIKSFIQSLGLSSKWCPILRQDYKILCAELFVHNILYSLGINRTKTKHCNLSLYEDLSIMEKITYKLISIFY